MTPNELAFHWLISQPHVRKEIISSKRVQTIEYWINAFRIACKVRVFSRGKCIQTDVHYYPETVKQAQAMGLLDNIPDLII